jgi:hypothetical protein
LKKLDDYLIKDKGLYAISYNEKDIKEKNLDEIKFELTLTKVLTV